MPDPGGALVDNYAEFIARLDTASANLRVRRDTLSQRVEILSLLHKQNTTGLQLWAQRRFRCSELLSKSAGNPEAHDALNELHEVALKMEQLFRNRTRRVEHRLAAILPRCAELDKALHALEKSRIKLTSSRMLWQERENLSRATGDLAGIMEGASIAGTDPGLRSDFQEARRAIFLAEALLEAKGE